MAVTWLSRPVRTNPTAMAKRAVMMGRAAADRAPKARSSTTSARRIPMAVLEPGCGCCEFLAGESDLQVGRPVAAGGGHHLHHVGPGVGARLGVEDHRGESDPAVGADLAALTLALVGAHDGPHGLDPGHPAEHLRDPGLDGRGCDRPGPHRYDDLVRAARRRREVLLQQLEGVGRLGVGQLEPGGEVGPGHVPDRHGGHEQNEPATEDYAAVPEAPARQCSQSDLRGEEGRPESTGADSGSS